MSKPRSAPARRTHLHKCGDYDACHRENPLEVDCRNCETEAFRKRVQDEIAREADPISRHPEGLRP